MYQRLNRHNIIVPLKESVINKARIEISRVFSALGLGDLIAIKEMVLDKFKLIRSKIKKGSKYRNIEKLVLVTTFFCLKLENVPVNPYELIEISGFPKKQFNDSILQLQRYIPEYSARNRQRYILQRILEVAEHFDLGMPFYYLSEKILYRLWDGIKNTTDNAVAGLISSISVLCSCKDEVRVSTICKRIGVQPSTIQAFFLYLSNKEVSGHQEAAILFFTIQVNGVALSGIPFLGQYHGRTIRSTHKIELNKISEIRSNI